MALKVTKFGGTSMATVESISQVASIIKMDDARKIVVVSAPGKRFKEDIKVTDLLYAAYQEKQEKGHCCDSLNKIKERFVELAKGLNVSMDFDSLFEEVGKGIDNSTTADYAASRGEYLSAVLTAKYLGFDFIDASKIIRFTDGTYDAEKTMQLLAPIFPIEKGIVVPGFYGSEEDGTIKTFSRGGSDVTGAILAAASKADVYENWTDVSGFMVVDPRKVDGAETMDILDYAELRELAYMGAGVLHPDSIFPVKELGTPINIRNTFRPEDKGTMIVKSYEGSAKKVITGIAGHKDNTTIFISKAMLNNEIGTVRKLLSVLEKHNISFEHLPTGIDTMSLVISDAQFKKADEDTLIAEIVEEIKPDKIKVFRDLALIAVVGKGMAKQVGTAAKIFTALAEARVNVRMIDQGSSEMNIIIGVENEDYDNAVKAIYHAFF